MRNIVVKSSIPLTKEQKRTLEDGIKSRENEDLLFTYVIDELVGGIVIVDGETLMDASLSLELHKIKKAYDRILLEEKEGISTLDIPKLLKEKVDAVVDHTIDIEICGKVISAADGVVHIDGLSNCRYGELILIGKKGYALAMNLERTSVGAILLTDTATAEYGDLAYTTGKIIEVPVGHKLLGRVINPLGEPLDGKERIAVSQSRRIECEAPRIIDRAEVKEPLRTGILAIDSMIPIGKGQRELIIGDRQTGKTSIAIDTILNQKGKNVYCIYVAIGQRASSVGKLIKTLEANDALNYTTVILSTAADSAPLQYIAPYTGAALAEHFMYLGKDVLVVYDDLSKHAVAYRTISLLLKRPAGREAYPGDVFYIHSKLLERAAKLSEEHGGGSITALPIIETQAGDISQYIPTNVISITDGQIYLERELFNAGQRPAINVGLSVSRVGGAAQTKIVRRLSSRLRLDIAHYRELAIFAQFGSSLDPETYRILNRGEKTVASLKQPECKPISELRAIIYLFAIVNGFLDKVSTKEIPEFLDGYYRHIRSNFHDICNEIIATGDLKEESEAKLNNETATFKRLYLEEK